MPDPDPVRAVRQFSTIPPWLAAALDADQVMLALNHHVPEFALGALTLRDCAIDQLHLKDTDAEWGRNWVLTVADADGERRIPIRVKLIAPGVATIDPPAETVPLESSDWQCWLPEVGLLCKRGRIKKDKELSSLKTLTDPEQARALLEQALRAQAPGYTQVSIRSCTPEVIHNKPGKSTVIRYNLDYGLDGAGHSWRDTAILKMYSDDIGHNAFAGMRAVWNAGLQKSAAVHIPEPLAYLAEQQAILMGPVAEEQDLEKLLDALLLSDDPADQETLHEVFHATGVALAAFHHCGAAVDQTTTWNEGFAEAAQQLTYLRVPFPESIAAVDRLVERLRALEAAVPADPLVPPTARFGRSRYCSPTGRSALSTSTISAWPSLPSISRCSAPRRWTTGCTASGSDPAMRQKSRSDVCESRR
jgi:hypothetical protein